MPDTQAKADAPDPTPVVDPLDATNSTNRGTNSITAYEAELAAALSAEATEDTQGDQLADDEASSYAQYSDETAADKEAAEEAIEEFSDEDDDTATENEPEAKATERFRFKDPSDQAVAAIAKAKGVSLVEAARLFAGEAIPTKRQQDGQVSVATETFASVSDTIKELQAQKREKLAGLEFEVAADLDAQIDDLRDKRDELRVSEVREQSLSDQKAEQRFYADYAENEDLTVRYYPDSSKSDSPLAKEMARLEAEMLEIGDPLYHSTGKPFALAKEAAKNLGIPMTNPNKPTIAKKSASNRPMQPASGNARTTATAPAVRQGEAIDKIGSIQDYEKFVASLG